MKKKQIHCPYCGAKASLRPASAVYGTATKVPDSYLYVCDRYYFLVPYIKEELHKREAKRIRKKCEKQDAAFDRFIIPEVSDPVEQVLLRHANYRISAYLQSVYPNATWEWREEFPERIIRGIFCPVWWSADMAVC